MRSGRFAVRITTEFGATATLNVVGPGGAFGELALLTPEAPRAARRSPRWRTPRRCRSTSSTSTACAARRPQTDALLVEVLAARVRELSEQLVEALHIPADTRVRRRLLDVVGAYGPAEAGAVVPLTQEELASLAGTSRATVNRVLREEQERGRWSSRAGAPRCVDPDALARRARGTFG